MKTLCLGLCLLNVLFFFWEFHKGGLNPPVRQQTTLPTIMLADELENARRGAVISQVMDSEVSAFSKAPIAEKPAANQPRLSEPKAEDVKMPPACSEIGPFADQQVATAWLAGQTLRGELINKEVLIPSAYLVYYPAAKNAEQMRIHKMMLNAKGINDIWVVPSGDLKGALSLGLFNAQERAVLFKNQLLQRGVQAEIKERYKPLPRLFVRIKGDQKIPKQLAEGLTLAGCSEH